MGQRDILHTVAKVLNQHKISYLLTGSLAVSYYGYPRATHDIDFVIEVQEGSALMIIKAMRTLGDQYIFDKDEAETAVEKCSQFSIYSPESGIKVDFWIARKNEFEISKFQRRKEVVFDKEKIFLISPEDLILTKLLWCKDIRSERHLRDCFGILKVQEKKLDKKYLSYWLEKFSLRKLFEEVSVNFSGREL